MTAFALKGLLGRKLRTALTAIAIVLGVAMISGTYVLDADHGWMEIHPVSRLSVLSVAAPPPPAPVTQPSTRPSAPYRKIHALQNSLPVTLRLLQSLDG